MSKNFKYTLNFVNEKLNGLNISLLSELGNVKTKSKFECLICGHIWTTCLDNIFNNGTRCRSCIYEEKRKKKCEDINLRLKERNIELIGDYLTSNSKKTNKNRFKCLVDGCGYEWETTISCVYKHGCRRCFGTEPLTKEIVRERIKDKAVDLIGEYVNVDTKTKWKCLIEDCGYEWEAIPYSVMNKCGCPKCGGTLKLEESYVKNELLKRNIELCEPYVRSRNKVEFKCLICNNKWKTTTDSVLKQGSGCPFCVKKNEKRILEFLKSKYKDVNTQKKIVVEGKRRYVDFVVNGVFIEYNGKQHYEPVEYFGGEKTFEEQQKRDEEVRKYCEKKNIKLLVIPYWLSDEEQYDLLIRNL